MAACLNTFLIAHLTGAEHDFKPPDAGVRQVSGRTSCDALAFYKWKAWTDLAPQRDKSQKTIRRYVVEVEK
jgi:hypothetical protein